MSETCYPCDATQEEHSTHTQSVGQTTSLAYQLTKAQPLPNVSTHNFINPQPRQLAISSTHNHTNPSTYQPTNSRPHQITASSTHNLINLSTHQLTNSHPHQPTTSPAHSLINLPTHQLTNSPTHNLINPQPLHPTISSTSPTSQPHQLKSLNCYLLFYNSTLIFAPF